MNMRKLFCVLAAVPLLLTGCLKSDNVSSKLEPVSRGMQIYNMVGVQNQMALQPAEIGIRLAMLLAEAQKQDKLGDFKNIRVDDIRVIVSLFGATEIEQTDYGYKIAYQYTKGMTRDDYVRSGVVRVRTNGAPTLSQTEVDGSKKWEVTVEDKLSLQQASDGRPIVITGGKTTLYNAGNGVYRIELNGLASYYYDENVVSNWSGIFDWRPADRNIAFSDCTDKESFFSGTGSGETFHPSVSGKSAHMWYRLVDGRMLSYRRIAGGTETCGFSSTSDYNPSYYPAADMEIVWSYDGTLSYVITYNGKSVTMP